MVLLSHRYKFIYISSYKTASSSVGSFFERFCVSPEEQETYVNIDDVDSRDTEYGIIGYRLNKSGTPKSGWYNHTSLSELIETLKRRKFIDANIILNTYFKFTNVRNPWDRMVSEYCFHKEKGYIKADVSFREYCLSQTVNRPASLITINGSVCSDYFIRYEHLYDDIVKVCQILSIPQKYYENIKEQVPHFKTDYRTFVKTCNESDTFNYRLWYDNDTKSHINTLYREDIDRFGYVF